MYEHEKIFTPSFVLDGSITTPLVFPAGQSTDSHGIKRKSVLTPKTGVIVGM